MADFPDQLALRVELAFGANPDGDPAGWTFTDVSADVLAEPVSVNRGTSDEGTEADASTFAFVLDNNSGDYTPGNVLSPHYPNVKLSTPCRLSVVDLPVELGGPDPLVRGTGFVSEWSPEWPAGDLSDGEAGEGHAVVAVTVAGILRRLGQGEGSIRSAVFRAISRHPNVVAYWPCEDDVGSTQAASPLAGVAPFSMPGTDFAATDGPPGSDRLLQVVTGTPVTTGRVPNHIARAVYVVQVAWRMDEDQAASRHILNIHTDRARWLMRITATTFNLQGFDLDDVLVVNETEARNDALFGQWVLAEFRWNRLGGSASATLYTADLAAIELNSVSTIAAGSAGRIVAVGVGGASGQSVWQQERFFGHLSVLTGTALELPLQPDANRHAPFHGFTGESVADRFERLCDEEGLRCELIGDASDTTAMGPQRPDTLLTLLRECAAAEGGIFGETLDDFSLLMRTRSDMYNQTPALVLDAGSGPGEITHPFAPILDDQQVRNDVTVERQGGSSARAVDEADISERGRYSESLTVNVAGDGQLPDIASWRLHLGIWPGMRYSQLSPALNQVPELIPTWAALKLGDRVQVINLPPQHPTDAVDLLVQGYTENLTPTSWDATANMSPAGPWQVGEYEAAEGGTYRYDTAGSSLASDFGSGTDTSMSVNVDILPLWTVDDDETPFDIECGGVRLTVTDISGASSPQTFTISTTVVNGINKTIPAGTPVSLWTKARYAL